MRITKKRAAEMQLAYFVSKDGVEIEVTLDEYMEEINDSTKRICGKDFVPTVFMGGGKSGYVKVKDGCEEPTLIGIME